MAHSKESRKTAIRDSGKFSSTALCRILNFFFDFIDYQATPVSMHTDATHIVETDSVALKAWHVLPAQCCLRCHQ